VGIAVFAALLFLSLLLLMLSHVRSCTAVLAPSVTSWGLGFAGFSLSRCFNSDTLELVPSRGCLSSQPTLGRQPSLLRDESPFAEQSWTLMALSGLCIGVIIFEVRVGGCRLRIFRCRCLLPWVFYMCFLLLRWRFLPSFSFCLWSFFYFFWFLWRSFCVAVLLLRSFWLVFSSKCYLWFSFVIVLFDLVILCFPCYLTYLFVFVDFCSLFRGPLFAF